MAWLIFKLAYYDIEVQFLSHYSTKTLSATLLGLSPLCYGDSSHNAIGTLPTTQRGFLQFLRLTNFHRKTAQTRHIVNLGAMAMKEYGAFPPNSSITGDSSSDCLVSYYQDTCLGGVLPLRRDAVGVFYSPSRLGSWHLEETKKNPDTTISSWQMLIFHLLI